VALSDRGRDAMAYWGTIQSAVSQRATTAEVWSAIRDAQAAEPGGGGLVTLVGVNEVRAAAAAIRNTSERLGSARALEDRSGLSQSITSQMMSTAPWSRAPGVLSTLADYQVRFEARLITPLGESITQNLTAMFPAGQLPATVGDLIDALATFAPASGSLQQGEFDGVGAVSIVAV
jgi:hypothetical protein